MPEKILSPTYGEEENLDSAAPYVWPMLTPVGACAENIPDTVVAFTE